MKGLGGNLNSEFHYSLEQALASGALFEQIVDAFPYPIQIFSPDGTAVSINKATEHVLGIKKKNHVGRYNVFVDPIVKKMGIEEQVREVLTGKIVRLIDLKVSYQDIVLFFDAEARDIQGMHVDITSYPLFDTGQAVSGFVSVFVFKRVFRGREDIQNGKQFLEIHWQNKYDVKAVAEAAKLSPDYFSRLFKKYEGVSPYQYFVKLKIDGLQEKLQDENLSVAEAFAACGVDYHSHFAKVFREHTGFSPSQYRKLNMPTKQ